jgi:hypothetical protein
MTRAIDFALYQVARDSREATLTAANAALQAIPGIGSGPMGLTPDHVRRSPEYQAARRAYDAAHHALGQLNGKWCKHFAPELRAEREARRAAKLAALESAPMP